MLFGTNCVREREGAREERKWAVAMKSLRVATVCIPFEDHFRMRVSRAERKRIGMECELSHGCGGGEWKGDKEIRNGDGIS